MSMDGLHVLKICEALIKRHHDCDAHDHEPEREPQCLICDCTDACGCPEGCSWIAVNGIGGGICSVCADVIGAAVSPRRKKAKR